MNLDNFEIKYLIRKVKQSLIEEQRICFIEGLGEEETNDVLLRYKNLLKKLKSLTT